MVEGNEIVRRHANDAGTWIVDVGYKEERYGDDHRQDEGQPAGSAFAIAEQEVAGDRCDHHQRPRPERYPIPPGGLSVALRVQHVIHPADDESHYRRLLLTGAARNCRPKLRLQPSGVVIDPPDIAL